MDSVRHLTPLDRAYPSRLQGFVYAPASLTLSGGTLEAECTVGVVGSRAATPEALSLTRSICLALAGRGAVIVSGGAVGIDAAAHRAALEAAGRTWVVAGTGPDRCFPKCHAGLFDQIGAGPGTMLWPFEAGRRHPSAFLQRNRLLVMLSDVVVVMQAGEQSGALHAARWARKLGKPLWVAAASRWTESFAGSRQLLDEGATALTSVAPLLASLALGPADGVGAVVTGEGTRRTDPNGRASAGVRLDQYLPENTTVWTVLSNTPLHLDRIASLANCSAQATAAALLTLALENVVVESPPGFFRRRNSW